MAGMALDDWEVVWGRFEQMYLETGTDANGSMMRETFEQLFRETDTDGSDSLSLDELSSLLTKSGYQFTLAQIKAQFSSVDEDGGNTISMDEFIKVMTEIPLVDHRRAMWRKAFIATDCYQSGTVDRGELWRAILKATGLGMGEHELEEIFTRMDTDYEGEVDWCKFINYFAGLPKEFFSDRENWP